MRENSFLLERLRSNYFIYLLLHEKNVINIQYNYLLYFILFIFLKLLIISYIRLISKIHQDSSIT